MTEAEPEDARRSRVGILGAGAVVVVALPLVVVHGVLLTPPDVVSTLLFAATEGAGAFVGVCAGTAAGLLVDRRSSSIGTIAVTGMLSIAATLVLDQLALAAASALARDAADPLVPPEAPAWIATYGYRALTGYALAVWAAWAAVRWPRKRKAAPASVRRES